MAKQQWFGFILLSFMCLILLKQVNSTRLLLQTSPIVVNPWLRLPNILPPLSQPTIPKFNFSLPPISLPPLSQPTIPKFNFSLPPISLPPLSQPTIPKFNFSLSPTSLPPLSLPTIPKFNFSLPPISIPQLSPHFPPLPQPQPPRPLLMSNMLRSIPPSTLPTWPTFSIPPLPSLPWSIPSPPPPSFPWTIPSPPLFSWSIPSPPPPSFPWTNLTNPLPTIPVLPWNSPSPPPPSSQSFPWNNPPSPFQNKPTFPWLTQSPPPPPSIVQTFPLINVTNPLPTIPSLPWTFPSPPPPNNPSFPWNIPSPPSNSPLFPWIIPSPPPQSFPWNNYSPAPPIPSFPWLNLSPPPIGGSSPLPPFGLSPGNPLFPTGIQFTFSNFTQSWLPEAGVKVTWQSIISVELSLQLFVQALVKPITLIISAIEGTQNGPGSWSNGFTDSKLDANIGAFCTMSGKDGFPVKGIVVAQTPINDAASSAITWFTILFNGWSKDTAPKATLDRTLGSFGGFVTNTSIANLKTFCSHPTSLNNIASKQGLYVLN